MAKQETRSSAPSWRLRPTSSRLARMADRRGPRPWTRSEREHFLGHLARHASLADALAEAGMDASEAWAERMRDAGFAREWDRSLTNRIARLPEMLLDAVVARLREPDLGDPSGRQAASIGQWLTEKCLPLMTRAMAPDRPAALGAPGSAAGEDWPETERRIARHLAQVRERLEAADRAAGNPALLEDGGGGDRDAPV